MGFTDLEKNKRAIVATNGNVTAAIEYLVGTWTWQTSQQLKGNRISISDNTVTKADTSWGNGTAIVSDAVILRHGSPVKQRWSFIIKAGDKHTIGVVTAAYNAASDEHINKTSKGWGYYQGDGNKGHGGPTNKAYGAKYQTGDIVDGAHAPHPARVCK